MYAEDAEHQVAAAPRGDHPARELDERVAEAVRRPFDIRTEPPVRAHLFTEADAPGGAAREHLLVLVLHHIAGRRLVDGPSSAATSATAYAARTRRTAPDWQPLPVQYADYALWQREVLGDDGDPDSPLARQLRYWRDALDGAAAGAGPAHRPAPAPGRHRPPRRPR
ncbi:Amino acid adenylation domain-containing protein/non-ribosomal peptide synthase protein (TIGR01720 family) OS=Streptomyces griseomycini OX=66895 GN=FHS37_007245 PE=4 SV=1 [Streptomyces griseomycini]